jgi:hypothetical protein
LLNISISVRVSGLPVALIALWLRVLKNHLVMHAIITTINQSTFSGDLPMEICK